MSSKYEIDQFVSDWPCFGVNNPRFLFHKFSNFTPPLPQVKGFFVPHISNWHHSKHLEWLSRILIGGQSKSVSKRVVMTLSF